MRSPGWLRSFPLTTVLPGSLTDRNVRVQKIFNGYLSVRNENFLDAYENSNSTEFANLAKKVKEAVSLGPPALLSTLAPPSPPGRKEAPAAPRRVTGALQHLGRGPRSQEGGCGLGWGLGAGVLGALWPAISLLSFPQLKFLYSGIPVLGPYYKTSTVTAFRWVLGGLAGGGVRCGGRAGCGARRGDETGRPCLKSQDARQSF